MPSLTRIVTLFQLAQLSPSVTSSTAETSLPVVEESINTVFNTVISDIYTTNISQYSKDKFAQSVLSRISELKSFDCVNGLLYRKSLYGLQLYIPPTSYVPTDDGNDTQLRHVLIHESHSATISGHVGVHRTLRALRYRYY